MPELPEVETVMRGLTPALVGRRLSHITLRRKDLRFPLPASLPRQLKNTRITGLERRAKYILVHFENGKTLLLHLGMSGRMVIHEKKTAPEKHDHVIFVTDKDTHIHFHDPRRFGMMDVAATARIHQHKLLKHLGAEPLDAAFTGALLHAQLQRRKSAVKLAIMDQHLVVGVGNIYASEALYAARISPLRKASTLSVAECAKLAAAIKKTLKRAIAKGGSTLRDYAQADGELGYFQHEFRVYGREGKACKGCGRRACITRIVQGGRATFYCAQIQK
jgi:formamidopyrimidine-DNA glycosylase